MNNEKETINFTRIDNDINGNPRYVCHFLNLLTDKEMNIGEDKNYMYANDPTDIKYEIALDRARKLGGKKYHTKKYGGGIVFQSYNTDDLTKRIEELKKD